jgi:hypothetical protein
MASGARLSQEPPFTDCHTGAPQDPGTPRTSVDAGGESDAALIVLRAVKVLFFSPFANIWEHAFPEALIAESFAAEGHEISMVRCDTYLQTHCVAMSAVGVGPDAPLATRQRVCAGCIKRRDLVTREMNLPATLMDSWIRPEDEVRVAELSATIDASTWTELMVDGIPLGRYAAYELWLNEKLTSTTLDERTFARYLGQLRNTLLTYFAATRMFAEIPTPDAVLVYNDHYSVNHAFVIAARAVGVSTWTIHGGHHIVRRPETMMMFRSDRTMEEVFQSDAWLRYRELPITRTEVDLVGGHFSGLLQAQSAFAYSSKFEGTSPAELRRRMGVPEGKRVLLAPLSSEDELLAARLIDAMPVTGISESLFADQYEWIEALFAYVKATPDVHLILRLHPRMYPNKREQVTSPVVARILALQENAPANVTFNKPSDGVGLYDLMQIVDVLANFRSSVGAELSAFGIPVVVPANADFFTYPNWLNRIGYTVEEFRAHLTAALEEGWSIENARRAFRWYAFLFSRVAVDFSDAVSSRPIAFRPKKPGKMLRFYNWAVFVFLQYGPLVRERLALRNRSLSPTSRAVLLDVLRSDLDSASDSSLWPDLGGTVERETDAIAGYLGDLSATLWREIDDPDSLAGRVRHGLGLPTPAVSDRGSVGRAVA